MSHLLRISELENTCLRIEPISKQLTTLIALTHPYQPLLSLLQRSTLEVCALLQPYEALVHVTQLRARIPELIRLITFMRDYAFESVRDEMVDSYLAQIKGGLEQCLKLIMDIDEVEISLQRHASEVV